ncbi:MULTISPECIES: LytR/AlgR family response regulator transcription factor [Bacillaceae]|uniref:LytR/AlgR family response regulator transcription factor n=1 Tax=Bacillaceae TaxID=186817 RepID=UPI001C5738E6|nr:LytTR family DNA-binding domain-containing protein [Rossellomorea sp. YZS02]MBW3112744.1 LytTR family DNA-binding domain-containing protein [Bacillus sp. MCCB 382]MDX8342722.1 LytTR family DNA-binding domain-containing protein [Rossellomorea sp. YZS02]
MRVAIIDDEPYSREEMKHLLSGYPWVEVVGEASSAEKGLEVILTKNPDVLFLDIEMPGMSGVDLAETLQKMKHKPEIVFATAYPDYALKAFRVEAVDYLLKPFEESQLAQTMERLKSLVKIETETRESPSLGKLAVQDEDKIVFISPQDILYIFREERETFICTEKKKYTCRLPIKDLEAKLATYPFFRVHKSYLVQLPFVEELIPWGSGVYQLKVHGADEAIPVSRNYVKELRERLEL